MEPEISVQTGVIIAVNFIIIVGNILIILVLCNTNCLHNVNKLFFYSLTFADLCLGLFITPFSILTSFFGQWVYGDNRFCQIEAYLTTIFWIAGLYSLMCINVDHYIAIRRPERYNTLMSPVRCICWTVFVWFSAFSFCCPPLFALHRARYDEEAFMCIIDTRLQLAYFITAGLIMTCPPIFGLIYTISYLCSSSFRKKREVYETILQDRASRPWNYFMNSVASVIFTLAWIPWCVLQVHDIIYSRNQNGYRSPLHFYLLWLAIGNSFYKFFIYITMSREFRMGLRQLWSKPDCSCSASRIQEQESNVITLDTKMRNRSTMDV
ncbi:G-protein coupled receptor 52-like [Octopus sinensis]|uniref:G-protein coupled receptor 52-like n=1 Tax=Octopus sinensis TaxID=2607531 RepID=A0A6P7TDU0_9MOLL|nr:G-protein coupled receptor 52-like [Octopus sinensis]